MWIYEQKTGKLSHDKVVVAYGYSGFKEGENNPSMENVHGVGPIPKGDYLISHDLEMSNKHGPYVLRLTPRFATDTFGRSGFLIHGYGEEHPELASHGCLVFEHTDRVKVHESGDFYLRVVTG